RDVSTNVTCCWSRPSSPRARSRSPRHCGLAGRGCAISSWSSKGERASSSPPSAALPTLSHRYRCGAPPRRGIPVRPGGAAPPRKDVESLAVNDFRDIPRDMMWTYVLCRLCDVVSFFGDAERAATLYDLLLPYAARCATVGVGASRGSVARSLGLLATVLARYDDAARHFESALQMNAHIRARVWLAHTQHDYARMLVARDGPGDRARATALAAQALATAREVGMKPLEAQVVELRAAAGLGEEPSTAPVPEGLRAPATAAVFRREGDVWTIAYEGKGLRLK